MANKVYRVITIVGRKRTIIWESAVFDGADGTADYMAFKEALREREKCSMSVLLAGHNKIANDKNYHFVDIIRCTK